MKETITQLTKFAVRGLMAVGALLGFTSCPRSALENVYGPPPRSNTIDSIEMRKLVYGPPPVMRVDSVKMIEDVYGPPVESPQSPMDEKVSDNPTE